MIDFLGAAVVGGHRLTREGAVVALRADPSLHVVVQASSIAEATGSDAAFDVCVLTDLDVGSEDDLGALCASVPTVVVVHGGGWRRHVEPWRAGAAAVVGTRAEGRALADAVGAAHRREAGMTPGLARALLAGATHHGVALPVALSHAVAHVARGRSVQAALSAVGLGERQWRDQLERLRRALPAEAPVPASLFPAGDLVPGVLPPEAAALTSREREVLAEYADGATYDDIAAHLHVSATTVRNHVKNALDKAGVARADGETRWCFAVYVSGRHTHPERLRRRLGLEGRAVPARAAGL